VPGFGAAGALPYCQFMPGRPIARGDGLDTPKAVAKMAVVELPPWGLGGWDENSDPVNQNALGRGEQL